MIRLAVIVFVSTLVLISLLPIAARVLGFLIVLAALMSFVTWLGLLPGMLAARRAARRAGGARERAGGSPPGGAPPPTADADGWYQDVQVSDTVTLPESALTKKGDGP